MDSRLGVFRGSDLQLGTSLGSRELGRQVEDFVPEGAQRLEDPPVGSLATVLPFRGGRRDWKLAEDVVGQRADQLPGAVRVSSRGSDFPIPLCLPRIWSGA